MAFVKYLSKIKDAKQTSPKKPYYFLVPENNEEAAIASILAQPYSCFIEQIKKKKADNIFSNTDNKPDLLLSFTTASCYYGNIAHLLSECLNKRFHLNNFKKNEIKTCLHEAIMNAVIHGNLCINSNFQTTNGLYNYQTEISKRLHMAIYRLKRVNIMVWNKNDHLQVSVSDKGNGFSIANFKEDYISPNGRGLMLIIRLSDSMWIGDDRRTLFMAFNHAS